MNRIWRPIGNSAYSIGLFPLVGLLALTCGACGIYAESKSDKASRNVKVEDKMGENIFGVRDEEFFSERFRISSDVGKRLIREGFRGLKIAGPKVVDLGRHDIFPIAAVRVEESMDASRWIFMEYALISSINISTGTLHAGHFFEQRFLDVERDLENNPPPPGRISEASSVDLFSRLQLGRLPAEYLVTVILLDQSSNRIRVKVGEAKLLGNETEFRKEIGKRTPEKIRRSDVHALQEISGGLPQLSEVDIPQESGIRGLMSLRPGVDGKEPQPWLQLSYCIPDPESLVNSEVEDAKDGKASVSIALLATGTKVPTPWIRHLRHFGTRKHKAGGKSSIEGSLNLRLTDLGGFEADQTYYLYAFIGEMMSTSMKLDW